MEYTEYAENVPECFATKSHEKGLIALVNIFRAPIGAVEVWFANRQFFVTFCGHKLRVCLPAI